MRVIWGDYFKQPQFDEFPDTHQLVHNIMLKHHQYKQHIDRAKGEEFVLVNEFAASFWATKNVATYTATCPYPPAEQVVYPDLKAS